MAKETSNETSNVRKFSLFSKPLSASLEQLVKPVYKKHGFAEHRILTQWPMIVGNPLAESSIPQKLTFKGKQKEQGVLYVLITNSARALELQHMQPQIIDRIATYFGYPAVAKLIFVPAEKALWEPQKKVVKKKNISPNALPATVIENCEDDDLRRALASLGDALAAIEN